MYVKLNTAGDREMVVRTSELASLDRGINVLTGVVKLAGSPEQVVYAAEALSRIVAIRTALADGKPLPTDLRSAKPIVDKPKDPE